MGKRKLKVFCGRWSEVEMYGKGLEDFAPFRAVAALNKTDALSELKCPESWFEMYFTELTEPMSDADLELYELTTSKPGVVFQSFVKTLHFEGIGSDPYHWIPETGIEEFNKKMLNAIMTKTEISKNSSTSSFNPLGVNTSSDMAKRMIDMLPGYGS